MLEVRPQRRPVRREEHGNDRDCADRAARGQRGGGNELRAAQDDGTVPGPRRKPALGSRGNSPARCRAWLRRNPPVPPCPCLRAQCCGLPISAGPVRELRRGQRRSASQDQAGTGQGDGMLRGDKAAAIYGDGVISAAVASAFARAGRAGGGADSRGAVAGRGPCDRQVPQVRQRLQPELPSGEDQ